MMLESIMLVVLGWGLGVVTTIVERRFHEKEHKSERRRQLYERDLRVVVDMIDVVIGVVEEVHLSKWTAGSWELPGVSERVREAWRMIWRSSIVVISLGDDELGRRHDELFFTFQSWSVAVGFVGIRQKGEKKWKEGEREEESEKAREAIGNLASQIRRRIREILEEV